MKTDVKKQHYADLLTAGETVRVFRDIFWSCLINTSLTGRSWSFAKRRSRWTFHGTGPYRDRLEPLLQQVRLVHVGLQERHREHELAGRGGQGSQL